MAPLEARTKTTTPTNDRTYLPKRFLGRNTLMSQGRRIERHEISTSSYIEAMRKAKYQNCDSEPVEHKIGLHHQLKYLAGGRKRPTVLTERRRVGRSADDLAVACAIACAYSKHLPRHAKTITEIAYIGIIAESSRGLNIGRLRIEGSATQYPQRTLS